MSAKLTCLAHAPTAFGPHMLLQILIVMVMGPGGMLFKKNGASIILSACIAVALGSAEHNA